MCGSRKTNIYLRKAVGPSFRVKFVLFILFFFFSRLVRSDDNDNGECEDPPDLRSTETNGVVCGEIRGVTRHQKPRKRAHAL